MSYSLNSLRGCYIGDYIWEPYRGLQEDARSLDYSSYHILLLLSVLPRGMRTALFLL